MKRFLPWLLPLVVLVQARADMLANIVEFTPAAGWVQADPLQPGQPPSPAPTIKYVPADGRPAAILLSLMMSNNPRFPVTDGPSLKRFNRMSSTPYLPSPNANPPTTELKIADGLGIYMMNEDPSLVGKPVPPGEYRFATTATLYLAGRFIVHATIMHNEKDAKEFKEAMQILVSAKVRAAVRAAIAREDAAAAAPTPTPAASTGASANEVSRPGFKAVLHLPPDRFRPTNLNPSGDPNYFSFADEAQGVMLSGWLDKATSFKGMRTFWAAEKKAMQEKGGIAVTDESFKIVSGWNVVLYSVPLGDQVQKNLRACRVKGDTWADVHLSISSPSGTYRDLEAILAAMTLTE